MKRPNIHNKYMMTAFGCLLAALCIIYYYFFSSMSVDSDTHYIYIDNDDTADSVYTKLSSVSNSQAITGFKTLASLSSYGSNIRSGCYEINGSNGALSVFRKLKNGLQTPVRLTIPSVRTVERLAGSISKKMMTDSITLLKAMTDTATCRKYGYTPETIVCMFIPNTYDIYWNASVDNIMERMEKESNSFWNNERTGKAASMGLSKNQVITLASIVDEETSNNAEKPMIAGMYYNRLKKDMPLQADPTIKFALKQFGLKRIYNNMLHTDSPYNTYKNTGLPPGPIRIPSVEGIDAVLNHANHDYLYMCAKEDFSGTHNFAVTYAEHLQNARKYTEALNRRGIK